MTNEPKKGVRRYDVDWLRVIAVCVLVLFHAAAMFNPRDRLTSIKGEPIFPVSIGLAFIHEWRLAVLFIVSGAGSRYALKSLSGARFVRGRFTRLVIPLVTGTLLLVPVHHYFGLLFQNPGGAESFPRFYAKALGDFLGRGSFGRGLESLHWAHLWFLAYLFVASLVALPLFLYLRGDGGRQLAERLGGFLSRGWMIFLLALPLIVVDVTLRARWTRSRLLIIDDWAGFLFYTTLFVYGFIIFSDERITRAIERHAKSALLLGLFTSTIFFALTFTGRVPAPRYDGPWSLYMVLRSCNVWFWCLTVLGFGSRYLNFNHRFLPYANGAVYPVYVLHLPIATVVAYWVVSWDVWAPAQLAFITLATLAASVCIYEFIIRRTKVTSFLFGLKPKKPKPGDDLRLAPEPAGRLPDSLLPPLP
jgi:peptidoglycan/LPS O-acetylase OafA/YrhL